MTKLRPDLPHTKISIATRVWSQIATPESLSIRLSTIFHFDLMPPMFATPEFGWGNPIDHPQIDELAPEQGIWIPVTVRPGVFGPWDVLRIEGWDPT
jgi:hypothetical protein